MASSEKKLIYLIGAGGHAKQVIDIFLSNNYFIFGAFDDKKPQGLFYRNVSIIGTITDIKTYINNDALFFCTIGDNIARKKICMSLASAGCKFINCISPLAYISPTATIGIGNYIGVYANISSDSVVGDYNIINDGATLMHDNMVCDYNHFAPNSSLGGRVKIGNMNLIGTNATINPDINISDDIIIGSGSVVIKSITERGTYVGVPCQKIYPPIPINKK